MTSTDRVVPEMRERLLINRDGKLTGNQWLDLVTQPLMSLLVLSIPLMLFIPRLMLAMGFWLIAMALVIVLTVLVFRAFRYARTPVHFAILESEQSTQVWRFFGAIRLKDENGRVLRFTKRLAPAPQLTRGKRYIAYYIKDNDVFTLLSIAPANHPKVEKWHPSQPFIKRFEQRGGQS